MSEFLSNFHFIRPFVLLLLLLALCPQPGA